MNTRPLRKLDYDLIVQVIDHWWGGPTSALAHPIFFYELGKMARVVEEEGNIVGFLLGFVAHVDDKNVGYVHLVGIHPDFRRRGVGKLLYSDFQKACELAQVASMKAMTTLGNEGSVRFHQALGWSMAQLADYAGPGRDRIVFEKSLRKPSPR